MQEHTNDPSHAASPLESATDILTIAAPPGQEFRLYDPQSETGYRTLQTLGELAEALDGMSRDQFIHHARRCWDDEHNDCADWVERAFGLPALVRAMRTSFSVPPEFSLYIRDFTEWKKRGSPGGSWFKPEPYDQMATDWLTRDITFEDIVAAVEEETGQPFRLRIEDVLIVPLSEVVNPAEPGEEADSDAPK